MFVGQARKVNDVLELKRLRLFLVDERSQWYIQQHGPSVKCALCK